MQNNNAERPTVPFALSLAGLTISVISALVVWLALGGVFGTFAGGNMMGGMMGGYGSGATGMMNGYSPWGMSGWGGLTWTWIPILVFSIAIAGLGVYLMYSVRMRDVRVGSVLVLVGAMLAFPTAFGFIAGSLLMVLGGIFGLTWSPVQQSRL